jgi:hypothetical protein
MPGLWHGHSSPIRRMIHRTLRGLLCVLPTGRQRGCFVSAKQIATWTFKTIARILPNRRANRHEDILRNGVGLFPPTTRTMPGTNRTDSPGTARMIRGTPTCLIHDLLRGLHRQLPSHSRTVVLTIVRTLIDVGRDVVRQLTGHHSSVARQLPG